MNSFFQKARIAWKFATALYIGQPLPRDYWTLEDAKAFSNFLTGDTGTKVRWMWRKRVAETAERAMMEMSDRSRYLCGYSAGVRSIIAETDQLLDIAQTREAIALSDEDIEALRERELL